MKFFNLVHQHRAVKMMGQDSCSKRMFRLGLFNCFYECDEAKEVAYGSNSTQLTYNILNSEGQLLNSKTTKSMVDLAKMTTMMA